MTKRGLSFEESFQRYVWHRVDGMTILCLWADTFRYLSPWRVMKKCVLAHEKFEDKGFIHRNAVLEMALPVWIGAHSRCPLASCCTKRFEVSGRRSGDGPWYRCQGFCWSQEHMFCFHSTAYWHFSPCLMKAFWDDPSCMASFTLSLFSVLCGAS